MKVEVIVREYSYLSQSFYNAPLNGTSDNYRLFCSNDFINGNSSVIIVKTKDDPK